jgi:hypothetical protein
MLHVFRNEKEKESVRSQIISTIYGDYFAHGLAPPTHDIVRRRFELTRRKEKYLPYQIREVTELIQGFGDSSRSVKVDTTDSSSSSATASNGKEVLEEKVVEEVLSFEDWMVDPSNPLQGRTLKIAGEHWDSMDAQLLLQHSSVLWTAEDQEEDEIAQDFAHRQQQEATTTQKSLETQKAVGEANNSEGKKAVDDQFANNNAREEQLRKDAAMVADDEVVEDGEEVVEEKAIEMEIDEEEDDDDMAWAN